MLDAQAAYLLAASRHYACCDALTGLMYAPFVGHLYYALSSLGVDHGVDMLEGGVVCVCVCGSNRP